jgi:leucyl-tRNA---protein transferase
LTLNPAFPREQAALGLPNLSGESPGVSDLGLQFPRFFMTAPGRCPYLPGRAERKVFTELEGKDAQAYLEALGHGGFRRSQNVAYRPNCEGCSACVSVRVPTPDFAPTDSQKRLARRNQDLHVFVCEPWSTEEQYQLLRRYLDDRHPSGGMTSMDHFDYADMVERTPVETVIYEYREPSDDETRPGALLGVSLTDLLSDGLSMVYSFYDPHSARKGLGTYMILDHIQRAQQMRRKYVYLGYWVKGSQKMDYKSRFQPLERLTPSGWFRFPESAART